MGTKGPAGEGLILDNEGGPALRLRVWAGVLSFLIRELPHDGVRELKEVGGEGLGNAAGRG